MPEVERVTSGTAAKTAVDVSRGVVAEGSTISTAQKLANALAQLSESERQIIAWRQNELLSQAEIAARLGISANAARQRCKTAMDHLRAHFRDEYRL